MKRFLSIIALLLTVCMLATCLFACSGEKKADDEETKAAENGGEEQKDNTNTVTGTFSDCLMLEKIGVVSTDQFSTYEGGLQYKDSETGLYGFISSEGLLDTGAIYCYYRNESKYFVVAQSKAVDVNDVANMNVCGLIDGRGNVIVPEKYANFDVLNERYVQAYTATERIYDSSQAMVYAYSGSELFETKPTETAYYTGTWVIYDLTTGQQVPGVSGADNGMVMARGNYITYYDANDQHITVDHSGAPLPEGATIFEDGSYKVEGQIGEVFDTNGNKLFAYDLTGYVPTGVSGGYYIASRRVSFRFLVNVDG